jgi:hypothetical protein
MLAEEAISNPRRKAPSLDKLVKIAPIPLQSETTQVHGEISNFSCVFTFLDVLSFLMIFDA